MLMVLLVVPVAWETAAENNVAAGTKMRISRWSQGRPERRAREKTPQDPEAERIDRRLDEEVGACNERSIDDGVAETAYFVGSDNQQECKCHLHREDGAG